MFKFALYDFLGRAKSYYLGTSETVPAEATTTVRNPSHFVLVLDCSGSMWGVMAALRLMVVKLLTLEEWRDADMLASVVSFSSAGDLITHASRVKIKDFMTPGSAALEAVGQLSTRGLTCISQGLKAIPALVRPNEVTAAVVLSDGFANDHSPGAEKREIDVIVENLRKIPGLFVNTISLGDWADFKLLSFMANACSGTCFQAPTAKEVYDVLHQTTTLVTGATSPALDLPLNDADYQVFVSLSARKIVGGDRSLLIRGLRPEDDKTTYRYREVEAAEYDASTLPLAEGTPVFAFAKAQLAEGNINRAKYALVAARDQTLLGAHSRALVSNEIALMSAAVEAAALDGTAGHTFSTTYGLPNAGVLSVLGVLSILSDYARDVSVDLVTLRDGYKKRGVKKIAGVRLPDGTIQKHWVKTAYRDTGDWANVSSFDINRNNATVNMLVTRAINLVKEEDGTVIPEVAGIKLDLSSFNNYTIVGDGTLNVAVLPLRIANKRLFRALVAANVLADVDFDPKAIHSIVLEGRPLIAYDATFSPTVLDGVFDRVARLKVLSSILTASSKGQSDTYTPEQIADLKTHLLSTSLYFNAPMVNEYPDLAQALADGVVDTRISYKVDFGTGSILNLGELYSANEYLARRFALTRSGTEEKKPKFEMRWESGIAYEIKSLTARTALNSVDDLMYPIFLDFLGLAPTGAVSQVLLSAGLDADFCTKFQAAAAGTTSKDTAVEVFTDARKALDAAIEKVFVDSVSPMVFYVGATGLVPDEFGALALTAEQIKQKHPSLSIGKSETDGTFYEVGSSILCVSCKAELFSTGKVASTVDED